MAGFNWIPHFSTGGLLFQDPIQDTTLHVALQWHFLFSHGGWGQWLSIVSSNRPFPNNQNVNKKDGYGDGEIAALTLCWASGTLNRLMDY